jgi:hypothetical protein
MAQLSKIFEGTLPAEQRVFFQAALTALRSRYRRLVIPCCGRFSIARAAVAAGFEPDAIRCSDMSLFSSVVGAFLGGGNASTLGVAFLNELTPFNDLLAGPCAFGALVVGMKAAQLKPDSYFENVVRRDLIASRSDYAREAQAALEKAMKPIMGVGYIPADMWGEIEEAAGDPEAILIVNPPAYKNGYTKMFQRINALVKWNAPMAQELDPKADLARLYELALKGEGALALLMRHQPPDDRVRPHIVFAHEFRANRLEYVLASRPQEIAVSVARKADAKVARPVWPLIGDDDIIWPHSRIAFAETTKEVALYLRDLWAHKLGVTRSESYYLMLLDGKVAGVFGLFTSKMARNQLPQIEEVFGFNAGLARYKRLNKLMMMCLVSGEAQRFFSNLKGVRCSLLELTDFQTTCIASVPELKTNRGILTIVERRRRKDGRYHINYRAQFNAMSFADCLAKWLARDVKIGVRDGERAAA